MFWNIASCEDPGVDFRMQGFHSAIQHFRKTSVIAHFGDLHTGLGKQFGGAAGGKYSDAELLQAFGKFNDAGFVGNTDEGSFDDGHFVVLGLKIQGSQKRCMTSRMRRT